ncbi:MAG: hypothetical protein ACTTKW_02550 [Schwartzia sp. (in: firmicutes)]
MTYASSEKVILDGVAASKKAEIMAAIDSLESEGATDGSKGIITAYELAEKPLRNSPYRGSTNLSDVILRLKDLPSVATDDYKEELLYLMKKFDQTK